MGLLLLRQQQGLERYFRDLGFDQNMVWESGNDKYFDRIRDLTVPREPGLAKNWARDAGFMFVLSDGNGGNRQDPPVLAAKAN